MEEIKLWIGMDMDGGVSAYISKPTWDEEYQAFIPQRMQDWAEFVGGEDFMPLFMGEKGMNPGDLVELQVVSITHEPKS